MCGRYAASRSDTDLVEAFAVDDVVGEPVAPSWNVAPTRQVRAVLTRRPDAGVHPPAPAGDRPPRQLRTLRWGLVPAWAKDVSVGARMINARAETVTEKPAFRRAAAHRRLLVPADGYYEWTLREGRKIPSYLHAHDDGPLALAGLYELWRDPAVAHDVSDAADADAAEAVHAHSGQWLWSLTILTRAATDELGHIHERCPVVVPPDMADDWLDPTFSGLDLVRQMLDAIPAPHLAVREVSSAVNSVRHDGPDLVLPASRGTDEPSSSP